eukprot:1142973-Pelagomonas_calceolata.AAC.3
MTFDPDGALVWKGRRFLSVLLSSWPCRVLWICVVLGLCDVSSRDAFSNDAFSHGTHTWLHKLKPCATRCTDAAFPIYMHSLLPTTAYFCGWMLECLRMLSCCAVCCAGAEAV